MRNDAPQGTEDSLSDDTTSASSRRNIRAVSKMEHEVLDERSLAARFSDAITRFAGTTTCLLIHVCWFGGWIVWNTNPVGLPAFDPFPFSFMTLVVSLEAIFL